MAAVVSPDGAVEMIDGKLAILIPLETGGAVLARLAKGIGELVKNLAHHNSFDSFSDFTISPQPVAGSPPETRN